MCFHLKSKTAEEGTWWVAQMPYSKKIMGSNHLGTGGFGGDCMFAVCKQTLDVKVLVNTNGSGERSKKTWQ